MTETNIDIAQHAPSPVARYNALLRLGFQNDAIDTLPILARMMHSDDDWGVRQGAAWAAGRTGAADALPPLLDVVTADGEDEQVRFVAALAMLYADRAAGMDRLNTLLAHPHEAVRRVAAAARCALPYVDV